MATKKATKTAEKTIKAELLSRTNLVKNLLATNGKICKVVFTKKNGEKRVLVGNVRKHSKHELGYIYMNDFSEKGKVRMVDPRSLVSLTAFSKTMVVK